MLHAIALIFGLIMGSFLGVVIDRLPKGESIVHGRSRCEFCNRDLDPIELVPIFSYVFQGGKCRKCKTKLSLRYPLLEIITGVSYLMVYDHFGYTIQTITSIIFVSILIVITFIDIDTMTIYDRFHIFVLILALIDFFIFKKDLLSLIIGALIVSVPLFIIALLTGGMGGGDIKLMFVAGAYLGFPNILAAFIIAVGFGGIYGIFTLISKKHEGKDAIPFGPFLCLGLFLALLYGQPLINWYLSLLR